MTLPDRSPPRACEYPECNRKIRLCDICRRCKCGLFHCKLHYDPLSHDCTYDYKKVDFKLEVEKLKCVAPKIN